MAHSGWTPEPWDWDQTGYADVEVFREDPDATDDGDGVEVIAEVAYYGDVDRMTANARRIVAAVNACHGVPTEALENGWLKEVLDAAAAVVRLGDVMDATQRMTDLEDALRWLYEEAPS